MTHLTRAELDAGLERIRSAPAAAGTLRYLVRRPAVGEREVIEDGALELVVGLVGDNWLTRGSRRTDNGLGHPDQQLNIMGIRAVELIAVSEDRWALAGDQLYVDLDLSKDNLPTGTRLAIGDAVVEVTELPHLGCKKFQARFGTDAMRFVNSEVGRQLRLRGLNAKVVQPGRVAVGDAVIRLDGD
jgi:hypothetical protein